MTENSANKSTDNCNATEPIANAMSLFIQLMAKSVARQLNQGHDADDDDPHE
ncbi:hypothetical protein [Bremerella sp.]|uniref:hypothetical protein n=1 Tax=Bremerella sp. TaxID=2795602 RepID=UPI00391969CE